jgi:D-apionolactonase
MLPTQLVQSGTLTPLPMPQRLQAGPLTLIFEAGDLRFIKLENHEILRRVYVAVRDHNWDTIPAVLHDLSVDIQATSFRIQYNAIHRRGNIHFAWRGVIDGTATGAITFTMAGEAHSSFLRNRIGFCVLHPAGAAGAACTITHSDGSLTQGQLPKLISPHQPFMDIQAITHQVTPTVNAKVSFGGDIFEMEDQRNWTDASYKTYSTPLALPYPVQIEAGTRIQQSVTVTLEGEVPAAHVAPASHSIQVYVGRQPTHPLLPLGLSTASHGKLLNQADIELLRPLRLNHLRVDLWLNQADVAAKLQQAWIEAQALDTRLELALFVTNDAERELAGLAQLLATLRPKTFACLIFHQQEKSTAARWLELAKVHLAPHLTGALFGAGSNAYFTELNREHPPVEQLDLVTFSINPQVHAFDHTSLVETVEVQATAVQSALAFSGGVPVAVSPVTLRPRYNPNATGAEAQPEPGELPTQVDPRQLSLFGAGWTLGSIKYLSTGGAHYATYYETTGWRGVMDGGAVPDDVPTFPALPGTVYPLYHLLLDVAEFAGGALLPTTTSDPLAVEVLGLTHAGENRLLLANLTQFAQQVTLHELPPSLSVRQLDGDTAWQAMQEPAAFRAASLPTSAPDGTLQRTLPPFAILCIDSSYPSAEQ